MGARQDKPPEQKRPDPWQGKPLPPHKVNMADELDDLYRQLHKIRRQMDITPHTLPPEADTNQLDEENSIEWPTTPHD